MAELASGLQIDGGYSGDPVEAGVESSQAGDGLGGKGRSRNTITAIGVVMSLSGAV